MLGLQIRFNQWLRREAQERTTDSLLEALNFDYFQLLDLLTIARSRRHIEKYYDLDEIGRFPERARPINVKADIDTLDRFPQLRDINRDIIEGSVQKLSHFLWGGGHAEAVVRACLRSGSMLR